MSFNPTPAFTNGLIFQPGGASAGNVATTWADVKAFIAKTFGAVVIYVDSSIAPAVVDAGTTDCQGRVVFTSAKPNEGVQMLLTIPDGATLLNPAKFSDALRVVAEGVATSCLDFSNGSLFILEGGVVFENQGTAACIVVPQNGFVFVGMTMGVNFLPTSGPLASLPLAPATFGVAAVSQSNFQGANNVVTGVVGTTLIMDFDAGVQSVPANPGFSGTPQLNLSDNSAFVTYQAAVPSNWPIPTPTKVAIALDDLAAGLAGANAQVIASVIYQPGGVSSGDTVATWPEVQTVIARSHGKCVVYVDDSMVTPAPALVPGATGVTECFGRLVIAPYKVDSIVYSVLQIEDGATLSNLYAIRDVEVRCNPQTVLSLTWSGVPNGGTLILQEFGALTVALTATISPISVTTGRFLILGTDDPILAGADYNDPVVPIVNVAAGAQFALLLCDTALTRNNLATGAGDVDFTYDNATAFYFPILGVPPKLAPGFTGTYNTANVDDLSQTITFLASQTDIFNSVTNPTTGTRRVRWSGCGGAGGGGGSGGGGTNPGTNGGGEGGGAGGGATYQIVEVDVDLSHRIDIFIGLGGIGGTAGAPSVGAEGGDGGPGADGSTTYVLDFTTNIVLAAFPGASGGGGGSGGPTGFGPVSISGAGGSTLPGAQVVASNGFASAGGSGGLGGDPGNPGNFGLVSIGAPVGGINLFSGGAGGTSGANIEGGGGGGGGAGPYGSGAVGGDGPDGAGTPGSDAGANTGAGGGGGGGGESATAAPMTQPGAAGGQGGSGRLTGFYFA